MSRDDHIANIRDFPARLRALVEGIQGEAATTDYDAGEWTVAQNIHHVVDAHINTYIRFKLMLTEDHPTLPRIDPEPFAELPDGCDAYIQDSLLLLEGLHGRWVRMMENITDWERTGYYPKLDMTFTLDFLVEAYSKHCDAHYAQIQKVLAARKVQAS